MQDSVRAYAPRAFPLTRTMPDDRLFSWIVTGVITFLAGIAHLVGLGAITDNGTPIFDEKHYVPQGYQILTNGHWVEDNPTYGLVVHPPLSKWFIAWGEWLFGYTPLGWRIASAIAGTILVFLIVRSTRRLSRSTIVGAIAGILAIVDGVLFVASRTALIDIFLITLVFAALSALLVDRDQVVDRLLEWREKQPDTGEFTRPLRYGPALGWRWWRITAGVCLGLACACKWSGAYFLLAFFLISLASDGLARKRVGVYFPWKAVLRRDVLWSILTLMVLPFIAYMSTWIPWFANETSYDRYLSSSVTEKDVWARSPWSPIHYFPALRSWWYYQIDEVLSFHASLTTSTRDHPHPWESKPWTWPMGLRPVLYYFHTSNQCPGCSARIMLVGTPTMWWPAFIFLLIGGWRAIVRRRWSYIIVFVSYMTAWLPWFTNIDRQMYYFYAIAMAPFLVMLIALIMGDFMGITAPIPQHSSLTAQHRLLISTSYISITILCFLWLLPIFTGIQISPLDMDMRIWMPSWN